MNQPQDVVAARNEARVVTPPHVAIIVLFAGIGGTLPTLSRLAATYVNNPNAPLPAYGLYLGLLIFFVIGAVLAVAMGERTLRQALIIGISAPALINSISAGVRDAQDAGAPSAVAPSGVEQLVDPETLQPVNTSHLVPDFTLLRSARASGDEDDAAMAAPRRGREVSLPRERLFGARDVDVSIEISGRTDSNARVRLRFFDEGGYEIGETATLTLRANARARLQAPTSARGMIAEVGGKRAVVRLPTDSFERARYVVKVTLDRSSDLLWALGFKRDVVDVHALDIRVAGVRAARPVVEVIDELSERFVFGFDASHFQKSIDWRAVHANGLRFAMLRATYGTRVDGKVDDFWRTYTATPAAARPAVGFYHFYRYRADQPPAAQAKAFLDLTADKRAPFMLPAAVVVAHNVYDDAIEQRTDTRAYIDGLRQLVQLIEASTGRPVTLFLDPEMASRVPLPAELLRRPLWVKDFSGQRPELPAGVKRYHVWQFGTGEVPGIEGVTLLDVFNGDEPAFRAYATATR